MERLLEALPGVPNRAQAEEIMQQALKVLYYRDKSTYNNWSIGFAEKVNFAISELLFQLRLTWFIKVNDYDRMR